LFASPAHQSDHNTLYSACDHKRGKNTQFEIRLASKSHRFLFIIDTWAALINHAPTHEQPSRTFLAAQNLKGEGLRSVQNFLNAVTDDFNGINL